MTVTKITLARLYNLGNYEHLRYEITVDVKEGEARTTLVGLEKLLESLNPVRPRHVPDDATLRQAKDHLADAALKTDLEVRRAVGVSKYAYIRSLKTKLEQATLATAKWEALQRRARAYLDDLGGAAKYVDAKQDWDSLDD